MFSLFERKIRCPHCGHKNPEQLTQCENPSCRQTLEAARALSIQSGGWERQHDQLAIRFEEPDMENIKVDSINIELGTTGLFFQGGQLKWQLPPGNHRFKDIRDKKGWFKPKVPVYIVLIDTSDIDLSFQFDELLTADNRKLKLSLETAINVKEPELLYINVLKNNKTLGYADIAANIEKGIVNLIEDYIRSKPIDELFQQRSGIRDELQIKSKLESFLQRDGIEVVDVMNVSIESPEYEQILAKRGQVSAARDKMEIFEAQTKIDQQIEETEWKDKTIKDEIKHKYEKKLRDMAMEEAIDQQQFEKLQIDLGHETAKKKQMQKHELETSAKDHQLGLEKKEDDYKMEKHLKQAELGTKILKLTKDLEYEEKLREVDIDRERLRALSNQDLASLIAYLPEDKARKLIELEEVKKRDINNQIEMERHKIRAEERDKFYNDKGEMLDKLLDIVDRSKTPVVSSEPQSNVCPYCREPLKYPVEKYHVCPHCKKALK